ncbi:hypothetical protein MJI95_39275, partial [Salmonella enterica subsp. enterica serovar Kentucky]|nr:hypothetical protein [Salmonella enterica subsp. enterica serovar Kentucky]
ACQSPSLTEFDGKLLKTLFLIRYVDVLKSTLDNLVTLSIERMEAADDISYCVADLEDAVEKRIFSVEQLYHHLYHAWGHHEKD